MEQLFTDYAKEAQKLMSSATTTELSYYPLIKALLSKILEAENLPFDVRTSTSESRSSGGRDLPDVAFYDGAGDYVVVCGEVKLPSAEISDIAFSQDRSDQIGRYLAQTGVVLVSNVRGFGLLTVRPEDAHGGIAPTDRRILEHVVELWPSRSAMEQGRPIPASAIEELLLLLETAVTRYAPISEPQSLGKDPRPPSETRQGSTTRTLHSGSQRPR